MSALCTSTIPAAGTATAGDGGADASATPPTSSVPAVARADEGSGETRRPGRAAGQSARLPLRLPMELLARIQMHAEERGETLSEFCRRALAQQIGRDHLVQRLDRERRAFKDGVWADLKRRTPLADARKEPSR